MDINADTIIGDVVKMNYKTAQVFEDSSIDFCCGGGISLKQACEKGSVNMNELIVKLETLVQFPDADSKYIDGLPLNELCDYIEKRHHTYVNENLPFIQQKLQKLCDVHGDHHIELFEIKELFDGAVENLNAHMHDEETILFPYLRKLVAYKNSTLTTNFEFLEVQNTIKQMDLEHTMEGERFAKIVRLTNNYTCPADGCNTYQVTFRTLQEFEKDLHRHIHLESNILFKKAVIFERDLTN